ncbi:glycine cleavage system protein GcvH [Ferroacidibacillus organovorans]|uniref:Glycine cleavage system H protein n=1 Tax=Ferroacidibacillus organovorans TaxID=1765683 RepID=A0A162T5P8_9BACL|nr:glycine cleavage system protein GcvH [Ferroacidibacillus organovorans]KYP80488.1 glycine cleavage system protein H [Ferroacidibacillus organovorans]OAG94717.1 glycine cleavage system protein H [Ferroacidibacillus organovorans]OPG16570.1 glycine cleavage system protein H [Ferroacidibacillus organovorans]
MSHTPKDLRYTKEHEWIRIQEKTAYIGITDFAQDELGDIVFVELPSVGDEVREGETFGTVESVKTVSDLYSPVTGVVVEVNESLNDNPENVNSKPYELGWMIAVEIKEDPTHLLTAEEYEALTNA